MALRRGIARFDGGAETENHRFGRFELISVALQPHQRSDSRPELHRVERFAEEVVGPGFDAPKALVPIGLGGDEDDRDEPRVFAVFEDPADLETLTLRQQVQHDQIGRVAGTHIEGSLPGVHTPHLVPIHGEQVVEQIGARRIVVSNENGGREHDPANLCNTSACNVINISWGTIDISWGKFACNL